MSTGNVPTSRGEILNFDNLIMRSKQPLNKKEAKTESTRQKVTKAIPLNIRGYMPSAPTVPVPLIAEEIKTVIIDRDTASSYSDTGVARSMSDLTGIKVNKATYMKALKDNLPAGMTPKDVAEQLAVNEILNNMKSSHPNANSAANDLDKKQGIRKHLSKISQGGDDITDLTTVEENS